MPITKNLKKGGLTAFCSLLPLLAQAHSADGAFSGWNDGFWHPLSGWDHVVVMLGVGLWAARQGGRALWLYPVTFIGLLGIGGVAGISGFNLPGSEAAILGSVVFIIGLMIRRSRPSVPVALLLIGSFGFCHGFAHGRELPGSLNVTAFGSGILLATVLLQAIGLVTARVVLFGLACFAGLNCIGQQTTNAPSGGGDLAELPKEPTRLSEVIVTGRADNLVGIAESATQGTVGSTQLEERPLLRSGELLETVPGVIITQHAGGGKANQYFLRGFNLDHGTDFATFLDGMPLNLPTHGHGQGYSDMNIVIPELVERVNYQKGVYYAENGDFSSAGAAHLEFFKILPQSLAIVEGGMYGYARGVVAGSPKVGDGHLLYGLEAVHEDGPWKRPDDYRKFNAMLTYSRGDDANGITATFRAYHGEWNSSDQIASSAVQSGQVPWFGSLDDSTGGDSQRYSLQAELKRGTPNSATKITAYGFYYDLDLFSDFTYFLTDTNRGDQFEQADRRYVVGVDARHSLFSRWADREIENTFGLQARSDWIRNGLYQTQDQKRVDKITFDELGQPLTLSATTRQDDVAQTSAGLFFKNKIQWNEKLRSIAGIRGDLYYYDVDSTLSANSGNRTAAIGSPKLTVILGPWANTEVYVQGGLGFHSNDGRGTATRVDPVTGAAVDRADALVRTYGAEVGARTLALKDLQSTLSIWWLDLDSELVFVSDAGATEASRPSRRYGVEWANYYNLTKHLALDADFSLSHAEFRDNAIDTSTGQAIGREIPGSVESVIAAGITYRAESGFFGSLRLRYFGPRPLIEDNTLRSGETLLLNAQIGWRFNKTWTISAEILNLLDRRDHDIDYAYESRVSPAAFAQTEIHFHPVEPIQARLALTARF